MRRSDESVESGIPLKEITNDSLNSSGRRVCTASRIGGALSHRIMPSTCVRVLRGEGLVVRPRGKLIVPGMPHPPPEVVGTCGTVGP